MINYYTKDTIKDTIKSVWVGNTRKELLQAVDDYRKNKDVVAFAEVRSFFINARVDKQTIQALCDEWYSIMSGTQSFANDVTDCKVIAP
jgi:hypothetical protein